MYDETRVYRSGHEQDMVSPLAQEIFSPRKQDMASPQHKEPIKYIYINARYGFSIKTIKYIHVNKIHIIHDIKQTNNNFTIIISVGF